MQFRIAAVLLLLGAIGTAATGDVILATPLDTSSLSFYGFYGFYGVEQGNNLECDIVIVKFHLYNYGAQDLTSVNTIRYIIDKTKEAIDMTYLEAVPTGDKGDYVTQVTELDGSAVTYITVKAEVNFVEGNFRFRSRRDIRQAGGTFASYIGLSKDDLSSATYKRDYFQAPPAPTEGACSLGLDVVVRGYQVDDLRNSESEMVAFQTTLQSAFQNAILISTGDSKAAAAATIEILGIVDAYSNGVAVRFYIHFSKDNGTCKAWQAKVEADPYSMGNKFGALSNRVKIEEITEVTDDIGDHPARKLLQNAVSGSNVNHENHLTRNVAKAGLGVSSINKGDCECRRESHSSFYGIYGNAINNFYDSDHDGSANPNSGITPDGAAAGLAGSSSLYGFYGSSSFYGVYGVETGAAVPGVPGVSSAAGSFYGYHADNTPSVPHTPSGPRPTSAPAVPAPPTDVLTPVYFTTILSDYDMNDLTGEDMAQFQSDYIAAVNSAIKLLGITSNPTVEVLKVSSGSVAVSTKVTFVNDPQGAELLMKVLSENPSLAFPSFSSMGTVTITDVGSKQVDESNIVGPNPPECKQLDRSGECCVAPFSLDAKLDCCWSGKVDECGVCGGDSSTCALAPVVRVSMPNKPGLTDKSSAAFQQMVADFKDSVAILFSNYKVDASHIDVDVAAIKTSVGTDGLLHMDVPFTIFPDTANGVTVPTIALAKSILTNAVDAKMTYHDITLEAVLSVGRKGVCGNSICETGEMMPVNGQSTADLCAADCPGVVSCPVGTAADLVGSRYKSCTDNGACVFSTGTCKCFPGYTGGNCGQCSAGYTASSGKCVSNEKTSEPTSPTAPAKGQSVTSDDAEKDKNRTRDIIIGVVFGFIGLMLIGLLMYWLIVLRARRSDSREEGLAFSSQQQVPASNEEPDIPTRQAAENTV